MPSPQSESYFEGKLLLEHLSSNRDSIGRFCTSDSRGVIAMFSANRTCDFIEYAEFKHMSIRRGFHYHKRFIEQLYVLSGSLTLVAQPLEASPTERIAVSIGAGDVITISPLVVHGFVALEPAAVISFGSGADPFVDRYPHSLDAV